MATKHTPGPWSIVDGPVYGASRQTNVEALDQGKHGTVICTRTISAPDYRTEKCDEYIANMHLIAAAPELLAALVAVVDAPYPSSPADCLTEDGYKRDRVAYDEAVANAREAIAKATL